MSKAGESRKQGNARAHDLYLRADRQQRAGNLNSAFRLLLTAAKLGDPAAQLSLGYTYDVGTGIRRNRESAMHWYLKAYRSLRGWGAAASNIGTIFRDEGNYPEAIRWFRRGARDGDVGANLELAKIQLKNPRQRDKAVACLREVMKANPPIGVSEDTQREAKLLLRKIEKNTPGGNNRRRSAR